MPEFVGAQTMIIDSNGAYGIYGYISLDFFCFFCNRGDTIQYHGGLRSKELGQAPMLLVSLSPRQALSSHLRVFIMIFWETMNFHPD